MDDKILFSTKNTLFMFKTLQIYEFNLYFFSAQYISLAIFKNI